jgi:hypothetical protein
MAVTTDKWLASPARLKLAASVLIAIPAVLLLTFALGEMFAGELSGAQHIAQAAPLLLLLAAGWRYPRVAGILLLALTTGLLLVWLVLVVWRRADGDYVLWTVSGLVLFALPGVGGLLLLRAAAITRSTTPPSH